MRHFDARMLDFFVTFANVCKMIIIVLILIQCEALENSNLLKYGEKNTFDENGSFAAIEYNSSTTDRNINIFDAKDEIIDRPTIGNYSERIVRNHSLIDVEYNQTDTKSNMTYVHGTLMTSDDEVSQRRAVFTATPPTHDFLALGESKTYICQAEENAKIITTHWVIPMSVDTYSSVQKSYTGIKGYVSMNASVMEIFNMQADFAGTYMCVGYGENGTISRHMELETTKLSRLGFSLRITIGLSAFGSVISILLLTVLVCKIKHLMISKIKRGRVKPNSKKTVHFNVNELNLITKRISQSEYNSASKNTCTFLIDKVSIKSSDSDSISTKKDDDDFDTLPRSENGDCRMNGKPITSVPILMVNGTTADVDLDSRGDKIDSPKTERSPPRFQMIGPTKPTQDEKETRF